VDDLTIVCERCGKTIEDVPTVRNEGECCHVWHEGSRLRAKMRQALADEPAAKQ
jgi:hypothetical protein